MQCFTPDSCLDGKTRARQSRIDIVRLARHLADRLDDTGDLSDDDHIDIGNCVNEFLATLPKADQKELRHG